MLIGCNKAKVHQDGVSLYQIDNDQLYPKKQPDELGINFKEFKNFIDQECPPGGKNKFDEDFAGYYFFHNFLHKSNYCRLPDGTVQLDTIDWIKGTKATEKKIRYAKYSTDFYINIPIAKAHEEKSVLNLPEVDDEINTRNLQFASRYLKLVTGIDDPTLIPKLIEINLQDKSYISKKDYENRKFKSVVSEKIVNGYKIRVIRSITPIQFGDMASILDRIGIEIVICKA